MEVSVRSRSGTPICTLKLAADASLADLKAAFYKENKKYYPDRQRFTLPPTDAAQKPEALVEGKPLTDQGVKTSVVFKDLGPQTSWKAVFLVEYLGPLLVCLFFYLRPSFIYGTDLPPLTEAQHTAFACFMFHYVKRELETLFLHRFSNATMPLTNIFRNSTYYWGFAAGMCYFTFHPLYTPTNQTRQIIGLGLFFSSEIGNFVTHAILATLRPKGTKVRKIPHGNLFDLVSCPNYTFEILAWFGYNLMTSTLIGWLFFLCGGAQMTVWAIKKHENYLREFDGKDGRELYPTRKILVPFLF